MLNMLSSLICLVVGSVVGGGEGVGGGDCWDGMAEQVFKSNNFFSDTVLHLRVQNISRASIQSICCTCSSLLHL